MTEHVEGRIAFLRAELKITDAQARVWDKFADTLRNSSKRLRDAILPKPGANQPQAQSIVQLVAAQERRLTARLQGIQEVKAQLDPLYAALSDEQKKTANELLAPQMGMGMMAMGRGVP
jgi:gamma-glutamyl phosphate reductase